MCAAIKKLPEEAIFLCRSTIVGNVLHYLTHRGFPVVLLYWIKV